MILEIMRGIWRNRGYVVGIISWIVGVVIVASVHLTMYKLCYK